MFETLFWPNSLPPAFDPTQRSLVTAPVCCPDPVQQLSEDSGTETHICVRVRGAGWAGALCATVTNGLCLLAPYTTAKHYYKATCGLNYFTTQNTINFR